MLRANHATVGWNSQKKRWEVRIQVGEEVMKRSLAGAGAKSDDAALKAQAVEVAKDEGYALGSCQRVGRTDSGPCGMSRDSDGATDTRGPVNRRYEDPRRLSRTGPSLAGIDAKHVGVRIHGFRVFGLAFKTYRGVRRSITVAAHGAGLRAMAMGQHAGAHSAGRSPAQ